ncbi:lipopolysaccharide biosynthesis protein [Salinicoccus roseus]|uniref:lipopolysaccharide biosynthesis protein n=1 Tax=Salinicoccus roseus TaxID=45670 RepID=UPI000F4D6E24|nr:oligosaccharide flippase family protein [Salinicoccus roseus]RPE54764.1 O-antigen/teichoic acid export membrane protein [Salinicoccus roseus]GGA62775.1 hypothetical protein GCM10007176_04070 [Salinicoccus roseus]
MNHKFKNFTKSKFVKNVFIMASGAAGAQAVTMALSPIVTRMYGPEAFGIMGTFSALTSIIVPIAALCYPIAIVLPKSEKDAKGLIKLSLLITTMITAFTLIILAFFHNDIVVLFQLEEIASYLYLIPLIIIFAGTVQVTEQWLIRTNQFTINANVKFLQSIVTNGSKVGIGTFYPTATVLVVLQVLGNGIKTLMIVMLARKSNYKSAKSSHEEGDSLKELANKHRDFPIYRAPQVLITAVSESLPILLLTSFFGPASAGFYSIGRTVLGLPSNLIGQSIGDVFYPRITEAANNGENVSHLIKKATFSLGAIGIIPFGLIIIFGPWLFELVFGSEWGRAGEYARWISLTSFMVLINKPSVRAMPVLNAQSIHLIYTFILVIIRTLGLIIGFAVFNSDIIAIALFGISSVIMNIFLFLITLKICKRREFNRV